MGKFETLTNIGSSVIVKKSGTNSDIIKTIHSVLPFAIKQAKNAKFDQILKGKTEIETCQNIWNFLRRNLRYKEDSIHFQDIKLPRKLVLDGSGDCKSYSLFTAAILKSLNIPFKFVYTSYNENKTPSHVYIQTDSGIIIDGVYSQFNKEKKWTYKYLKKE